MFAKSPRCQVVPLPGKQVVFAVDGRERLRWHASDGSPRPFFFPLIGPSGFPLTRMGHPGAPNHDHHRSIWFAHHKVLGMDFWSDTSDTVIRQSGWLAYEDGDQAARMAVELGWFDGHDPAPLVKQELIASVGPDEGDGVLVEIQTSLTSMAESLELEQTNFGLLAVRVARSISATFGGGVLTGANGKQTEKRLFGQKSAWMDYSGPIEGESTDAEVVEGITYFDHPQNNSFPSKWHVRDDGWMGASICRDNSVMLRHDEPTVWRYMLHAHVDHVDVDSANAIAKDFQERDRLIVRPSSKAHHTNEIGRVT
ncbi:MAG: PmoA family protein [Rubripirellula sp.]